MFLKMSFFLIFLTIEIDARFDLQWDQNNYMEKVEGAMIQVANTNVLEARDWQNGDECGTYMRFFSDFSENFWEKKYFCLQKNSLRASSLDLKTV